MAHDPQKLAYWIQHFQRWHASGLSQRAYCQGEGLSFSSFDHWRQKSQKVADRSESQVRSPLTLIPVGLEKTSGSAILLRSPAGWQITVPMDHLAQALPLLAELP